MSDTERAVSNADVQRIISYLTSTFEKATSGMQRPVRNKEFPKGNELYRLQFEFAHLIDDVIRGPRGLLQRSIANCNDFIDDVVASR